MERKETVLVIDDEELVRLHLRMLLQEAGFLVLLAADGRQGMEIFASERPDLVLTDLRMPELDGMGVIGELKLRFPEIPVIVVSATSDVRNALDSLRSGAWDYIVKPIEDPAAFQVVIRRTLERKRLLDENRRYQDSLEEMVRERTREVQILSQVAAQSPVSVIITGLDGRIEYVNPCFTETTGYQAAEVLGRAPGLLSTERTSKDTHREIRETVSAGGVWEGELSNRKKNGEPYLVHAIISAIREADGGISHYVAVQEDITEKVRLAQEAQQAQAKLIQADKLASLGLLLSGMAHEINNPNNLIMRNSEILTEAWAAALPILEEYYREHGDFYLGDLPFSQARAILPRLFAGLTDGSRRIRSIVERLKNFARQDAGSHRAPFDLNVVLSEALSLLNHEIVKRCEHFSVEQGKGLPPAMGNAQQVEQVIINLVMNALQALPDKGRAVRVTTALSADEGSLLISIEDQGCGMTAEVLQRLSEPFFTTRGESGGTGLGLYITSSLLRDNGGALSFASRAGEGTTATVTLPVFRQGRGMEEQK